MRFLLVLACLPILLSAQQVEPTLLGTMPSIIDEASGLLCPHPDTCWTHNDTENSTRIYSIDATGSLIEDRNLGMASQVDYEDMAYDENGHWFVGDFGNNDNDREDLVIYRFTSPSIDESNVLPTQAIPFVLSDQTAFPPAENSLNFDIEAMVVDGEDIIIFSRNRTIPFNGICKIYRLTNAIESQIAELFASFFASTDPSLGTISGAALSPSGEQLLLVASSRIYLWDAFQGTGTDFNNPTIMDIINPASFEGVAFVNECLVRLVTDENGTSRLFEFDLCALGTGEEVLEESKNLVHDGQGLWSHSKDVSGLWSCYDISGRLVRRAKGSRIDVSDLNTGHYVVHFQSNKALISAHFILE